MKVMKGVVVLVLCLAACQKREKLSAPLFSVQVSPTAVNVIAGGQKGFTAKILSPSGAELDATPEWTLSSALLGTLSPRTGNQVTFTAGSALGVSGTLEVAYNGMQDSAQLWVGANPGKAATSYGLFSESLPTGIKFDVTNPPDSDGGYLGTFKFSGGTLQLENATQVGQFTEGTKSLKVTVSGDATSTVGCYISFGYPDAPGVVKDFSAFLGGDLRFDLRAPAGKKISVKLEGSGGNKTLALTDFTTFDDTFHSLTIPLSSFTGVDISQWDTLSFVVEAPNASGDFSFYMDNLRIER